MGKRSDYTAVLKSLPADQWAAYLDSESGLPGPSREHRTCGGVCRCG